MIEEPPLLQILTAASRQRPTEDQIAAFRGVPTGNICDAMGGSGALDMAIKPLPGLPKTVCGPALTVDCGAADVLAIVAAITEVQPGDVLVQSVDGYQGCAALGDMVSGMAKNAGAAGIVSEGPVRDIAGIAELNLPVFATGINPNSPFGSGPGKVGHPIVAGGRPVASGDIVVGDSDGVVVIPFARIDATIAALADVQAAETALEARVKDGMAYPDDIAELVASDRCERT